MSTNEPTVTVEATIIEMVRAMAAMGHALAARVESHRSAAAANRLGEHKVWLEQSLEDAYRKNAELREKIGEALLRRDQLGVQLANVQREWRAAVVLVGEGHAARDAAVAELADANSKREAAERALADTRGQLDTARGQRDAAVAGLAIRLRAAKELGQVTDVELDREVARLLGHQVIPADRPE